MGVRGRCATVERLNQYLEHRVPELLQNPSLHQTPYVIAEPINRAHLILMPQHASLAEISVLKNDAYQAEVNTKLDLAEQLWIRVLAAASGYDMQAIQAIQRIGIAKQQGVQAKPLERPQSDIESATSEKSSGTASQRNEAQQLVQPPALWEEKKSIRGEDLRLDLDLTLQEAAFGGQKEIRISHLETCTHCNGFAGKHGIQPQICSTCTGAGEERQRVRTPFGSFTQNSKCSACNGTGKMIENKCEVCNGMGQTQEARKLLITVPAGVDTGTRLRVQGEGDAGWDGGATGDLLTRQ